MKRNINLSAIGLLLTIQGTFAAQCLLDRLPEPPAGGYVPDAKTAAKIAEAVLAPIYGEAMVKRELPLHAVLEKGTGIWNVQGTPYNPENLPDVTGGAVMVRLSKKDGKILFVSHGK